MWSGGIGGNRVWRPCPGLIVEVLSEEAIEIRPNAGGPVERLRCERGNSLARGGTSLTQKWENEGYKWEGRSQESLRKGLMSDA